MVELDVFRGRGGTLVLGHSRKELEAEPTTLDDAFALLAERSPQTGLVTDIKGAGLEGELVDALRRHRLVERAVASTFDLGTLQALRRLEPALTRSRTYPPARLHLGKRRTFVPIVGPVLLAMRLALPLRIEELVADATASAATLKYQLVTRAVVERCHASGVAVLVWTVDDRAVLARLDRLGVDGVITNDPRIFNSGNGATLTA
jgi:glycerophosphoryl diester phosphodiesterase